MKPTGSRLLVRQVLEVVVEEPLKDGEIKTDVLIKPKIASNATVIAEVIAFGPKAEAVNVGDKVAFSPYGYDEVVLNGETHIVVDEGMILGVMD